MWREPGGTDQGGDGHSEGSHAAVDDAAGVSQHLEYQARVLVVQEHPLQAPHTGRHQDQGGADEGAGPAREAQWEGDSRGLPGAVCLYQPRDGH